MVERSFLIIEALAILFCLHGLYGEKFRWSIYTILYLAVDFIGYQVGYVYDRTQECKVVLLILLFVYVKLQFRSSWKISVINYILDIIICFILQIISYYPLFILFGVKSYPYTYFGVNMVLLLSIYILYKVGVLNKIALYIQQKGRMVIFILIILMSFLILTMYSSGIYKKLEVLDYYFLIGSIILLFPLLYYLQKERWLNKQMIVEKDLNSLYSKAVVELIEKVRMNQHDYKNQLTTIQGMVYTAKSIDELRIEQEKYYQVIKQEDKYYQIISGNNDPVIAGFLYSKLCNVDSNNIQIGCSLKVDKIENILLTADIIKILGILIDNAFEEVSKDEYKKKSIDIELYEELESLKIKVGNICRHINIVEMEKFFKKGTSSKGTDRGYGLYNVSRIIRYWKGTIVPENVERNEENWFYFTVEIPKEK